MDGSQQLGLESQPSLETATSNNFMTTNEAPTSLAASESRADSEQDTSSPAPDVTVALVVDDNEAESIRLARDDLREKLAAQGLSPVAGMDASEAESLSLARDDLREKLASNPQGLFSKDQDKMDASQTESLRLARDDLREKLASNPQGLSPTTTFDDDDQVLMDASQTESLRLAREDIREKHASGSLQEMTSLSASHKFQLVAPNPPPPPGAVSVDMNSRTLTQLSPVNLINFSQSDEPIRVDLAVQPSPPPHHTSGSQDEVLLEAQLVEDESGHLSHDKVLVSAEELICGLSSQQMRGLGMCAAVLMIAILAGAIALVTGSSDDSTLVPTSVPTLSPTLTPGTTLEQIRERGFLKCGIWKESFDAFNMAGIYETSEDQVDFLLCKAFAAAILGDPDKHEIVLTEQEANLMELTNDKFDLVLSQAHTGMQSDVYDGENGNDRGFSFSVPYAYLDIVFGGVPEYVACADDMNARGNCSGIKICATDKGFYFDQLIKKLPESHIVRVNDTLSVVAQFVLGACNVIPSDTSGIMEWGLHDIFGYSGPYVRGSVPFEFEVLSVATNDDDEEFADFVSIILLGLMAAEKANVTSETAELMAASMVLGEELVEAVRTVGNYHQLYERGIGPTVERSTWNTLNDGTTGVLISEPFGIVRMNGPGPAPGGTLARIRNHRTLNCGVRPNRTGFAMLDESGTWVGMDIEYCTALAAAALEGESEAVNFIAVEDEADGYRKLQAGAVDVLAGFEWNVINDYQEPTTGEGYTFSQPYFYRPNEGAALNSTSFLLDDAENLCLVTSQDDVQFSSFVYWTVASTFYAAEVGITIYTANDMPQIQLFGDEYLNCFRNAIYFAGSYDEIYDRNLGVLLPERGRNAINHFRDPGPQLYVPPGFFQDRGVN